jgi:hypothetical protein
MSQKTDDPQLRPGRDRDYKAVLDAFSAAQKSPAASVDHLMSLGYSRGQARSAVHRYREQLGLLLKRTRSIGRVGGATP